MKQPKASPFVILWLSSISLDLVTFSTWQLIKLTYVYRR
jgi:hypothetical protein